MAQLNRCFLLLLTLVISSLILTATATATAAAAFTTLDVSGSIHTTLNLFSLQSQAKEEQPLVLSSIAPPSSSSPLYIRIHPRASLHAPHKSHTDYKSLTATRLARDSSRVNSLIASTELALHGISRAELKPLEAEYSASDLEAPVTSGTSQGSGEYFSRVGVGSPAKEFYMVVDTGSDVSWLQCSPCADCYQQSDPTFDPASSATFAPLTCGSSQCGNLEVSACRDDTCLYQVSYGDGSYTVGDFATETVSFGSSGAVPGVAVGCGHDNEGLFVGAAGLLGLGGGPLSLPSQIKATSFSYCLVDRDSVKSSTLEFNSATPTESSSVVAPMLKNSKLNTFYYIGLTGFSVGGQPVSIPPTLFSLDDSGSGGVIIDSGTAITRLPTQAYNSLRDSFTQLTQHLKPASSIALFDTCYDFSSMTSVKVPTVSLHFDGDRTLDLPAKNYLIPVDSSGTFCFGFAKTASSMSIIGNVQQQGTRVHFDIDKSQVTFSRNNC